MTSLRHQDPNKNRPDYKKTKVGWIPKDWVCSPLVKSLDSIIDYRGKAPIKAPSGVTLITARNIRKGYIDFSAGRECIPEKEYDTWMRRGIPRAGDLLFTTEAPLGNAAMFPNVGRYALAQRVIALRGKPKTLSGMFLMFYLLSPRGAKEVQTLGTGSTAKGIKQSALKTLPLLLPLFPEQNKIAEIISTWDEAIEQTRKLIEARKRRKRGLMQQLLTGKKRLPGFAKSRGRHMTPLGALPLDWPLRHLGDVFGKVKRKNNAGMTVVLTASGEHGLVDQQTYFTKSVSGQDLSTYYLLKRGEFAYNRSAMNGYPYGAIKRLDQHEAGVLSILYSCFSLQNKDCVSDFYMHFFEAGLLNRQLRAIAQVGGRAHGLLNVADSDFYAVRIPVPSKAEQQAIAAVLQTADEEVAKLEAKLAALETQKRGLMQKLLTGTVRVKAG